MTLAVFQSKIVHHIFLTNTTKFRDITVIYLEIGSESRDSHSQKPANPSDKRVSPQLSVFKLISSAKFVAAFVKRLELCNRQFHAN